jgi:hypothetical protein
LQASAGGVRVEAGWQAESGERPKTGDGGQAARAAGVEEIGAQTDTRGPRPMAGVALSAPVSSADVRAGG